MLYLVVNGLMYQKVDGEVRDIPFPLTPETSRETEEVWRRYDESGQPFLMYHDTSKDHEAPMATERNPASGYPDQLSEIIDLLRSIDDKLGRLLAVVNRAEAVERQSRCTGDDHQNERPVPRDDDAKAFDEWLDKALVAKGMKLSGEATRSQAEHLAELARKLPGGP